MNVLFAVSNESIFETIVKKYEQQYNEKISGKNVYYFNAILQELQKDKTYDRVIISEDLEMYANNNFDVIDKFIFEKLKGISNEAFNGFQKEIPIILICADRRTKRDNNLVKIFEMGIYNGLIGNDRSVDKLCMLLNRPRNKTEAKEYYEIQLEESDSIVDDVDNVSETEIQNILTYYKRLGRNEVKYIESFNSIAAQYNDTQLRLIAKFLPNNVRKILEERSTKYQQLMNTGEGIARRENYSFKSKKKNKKEEIVESENQTNRVDFIDQQLERKRIQGSIVIPKARKNIRRMFGENEGEYNDLINNGESFTIMNDYNEDNSANDYNAYIKNNYNDYNENTSEYDFQRGETSNFDEQENTIPEYREEYYGEDENMSSTGNNNGSMEKRGRGRPPKKTTDNKNDIVEFKIEDLEMEQNNQTETKKRGRGRPPKNASAVPNSTSKQHTINMKPEPEVNLFDLTDEDEEDDVILPGMGDYEDEEVIDIVPNRREQNTRNNYKNGNERSNNDDYSSNYNEPRQAQENNYYNNAQRENNYNNNRRENNQNNDGQQRYNNYNNNSGRFNADYENAYNESTNNMPEYNSIESSESIQNYITRDKKIVAFVGTSKNGTSFIVNNLAELFSKQGIKTAILDLTKNKNAYYIYTKNDEDLRKVALNSVRNLKQGMARGIEVHKNLTVYTSIPVNDDSAENYSEDYESILTTLVKNYSVVLLDCDFETDLHYIKEAQELYVVQSLDVLTIQPITEYLRELKTKKILNQNKLRIILNKYTKIRGITERVIIGGIANYNEPAMSFMTELFDKDTVRYTVISFDVITYAKYLESLIDCEISLNKYTKNFNMELAKLGNMVYPLISDKTSQTFSNSIDSTLAKMKNNY